MNYIKELKKFLDKKSEKNKIVVIYGPTASGKTDMSIDIAKYLDTEIISTDSRQIYKYMDIGTGKILEDEKQGVVHHMLDIIEPSEDYSVGEFKKEVEVIIEKLYEHNKIPILCGGTGLYIDSLIYDFNIPKIGADEDLRSELEEFRQKNGNEALLEKLREIDTEYAQELHPNNYRYVMRGIEVKTLTGKSKLEFREEKKLKYDVLFLCPEYKDREYLYNRINKRVRMMFDSGLIEEVKTLLEKGYNKTDPGMNSIGYKEVVEYLEGNITKEESIEAVQKNSRNYAKRQETWFKKYKN